MVELIKVLWWPVIAPSLIVGIVVFFVAMLVLWRDPRNTRNGEQGSE